MKAQTSEGVFKNLWKIPSHRRFYQRVMKELLVAGWATKLGPRTIALRSYQEIWRSLKIPRLRKRGKGWHDASRRPSGYSWAYFKIPVEQLDNDRQNYYRQLETIIRRKIANLVRGQIRWNLKQTQVNSNEANFACLTAASWFGFRSPSTGSKLRKKYFDLIPQTAEESRPYFSRIHGRFESRTKQIAL